MIPSTIQYYYCILSLHSTILYTLLHYTIHSPDLPNPEGNFSSGLPEVE